MRRCASRTAPLPNSDCRTGCAETRRKACETVYLLDAMHILHTCLSVSWQRSRPRKKHFVRTRVTALPSLGTRHLVTRQPRCVRGAWGFSRQGLGFIKLLYLKRSTGAKAETIPRRIPSAAGVRGSAQLVAVICDSPDGIPYSVPAY